MPMVWADDKEMDIIIYDKELAVSILFAAKRCTVFIFANHCQEARAFVCDLLIGSALLSRHAS